MQRFELFFEGTAFGIPRKSLFEFLDHHRDLLDTRAYTVQSNVSGAIFQDFLDFLKNQTKPLITKLNAAPFSLLAEEFCLTELARECA
jgi:hypothetical protein